ncbi:MAG: hypothetical protein ACYSQZ_04820 [Planctomycetota bacterium]|jgi:hypothetical protein
MAATHEKKRYPTAQTALLGFFVLALLIARFIVTSRSKIILSGPITLGFSGLSISLPSGNGWQSATQWSRDKNVFVLSSLFDIGSGVDVQVDCRYFLAEANTSPAAKLEHKASEVQGQITEEGQIQTASATIHWAYITWPKTMASMFFGTTHLTKNRQLDVILLQRTGDIERARHIFDLVAQSLEFESNELFQAGSEIIKEIKNTSIAYFLDNSNRQTYLLRRDAMGRPVGFTAEVIVDFGQDTELNIRASSLSCLRGRRLTEQEVTVFESDNSFDDFTWKSESSGLAGRSGIEITSSRGLMTVRYYGRADEENYHLSEFAIPDILAETALTQMLFSNYRKIILDIVTADGRIMPALISRIEAEEDTGYVFALEFLNDPDISQIYLDEQKYILKKVWKGKGVIFERATIDDIASRFPEHADYLKHKKIMPKQNQL